jgi:hypothetical protein
MSFPIQLPISAVKHSAVNRHGSQSRRSRKPVILSKESPQIAFGAMARSENNVDVEKKTGGIAVQGAESLRKTLIVSPITIRVVSLE